MPSTSPLIRGYSSCDATWLCLLIDQMGVEQTDFVEYGTGLGNAREPSSRPKRQQLIKCLNQLESDMSGLLPDCYGRAGNFAELVHAGCGRSDTAKQNSSRAREINGSSGQARAGSAAYMSFLVASPVTRNALQPNSEETTKRSVRCA